MATTISFLDINDPNLSVELIPLVGWEFDKYARDLLKAVIEKVKNEGGDFFAVLDFIIENSKSENRSHLRALVPHLDHLSEISFMSVQCLFLKYLIDITYVS